MLHLKLTLLSTVLAVHQLTLFLSPQDLPPLKGMAPDDVMSPIPRPAGDHDEDLSEYKFQKYAATYFQGNINHQYSRKQLKQPLLPLQTQGDQLVMFFLILVMFVSYRRVYTHSLYLLTSLD